jgi:hypothetical protein
VIGARDRYSIIEFQKKNERGVEFGGEVSMGKVSS